MTAPSASRFEVGQSRSSSHCHSRLEQIARFSRLTRPPNFERASQHLEATRPELRIFEHILVQSVVKSRFSSLSERLSLSV